MRERRQQSGGVNEFAQKMGVVLEAVEVDLSVDLREVSWGRAEGD